jgi:L-methionine (R)-S-oxide reductase
VHEAQTLDAITPELAAPERYARLRVALAALTDGERDWLANLCNVAAALYAALPNLNWAGFYLMRGGELVVGPFQGLPACVRIAVGRGVCGTAALQRRTLVVDDVHAFPGHIACDPRSRSEIVVPIFSSGEVVAVIDLDSDRLGRFGDVDRAGLEAIAADLSSTIDWGRATAS